MSTDAGPLDFAGPSPLPPDAVLVHIGMHKTGTTAMQSVLSGLREDLAAKGVLYPGDREAHHVEARALTRSTLGWQTAPVPPPDPAVWDDLAAQVRHASGRVVLSSEFFSSASAEQAAQLVQDIGPERTHILVGVRNLGPVAISSWQQTLKQGRVSTLDRWLKANFERTDPSEPPKWFWARFDPVTTLERWSKAAGPERVSVVVIRDGERALLPTTFERLLDLPAGLLTERPVPRSNRGLTAAEAEAVRQVNAHLRGKLEWAEYDLMVRNGAIRRLVEHRQPGPDEPRPQLPAWVLDQVTVEGQRVADQITASGVNVIGDLADLSDPVRAAAPSNSPASGPSRSAETTVPLAEMVESLVGAVAGATYGQPTFDEGRADQLMRINQAKASRLAAVLARRAATRTRRLIRRR
jgi:hypothetical protein